MLEWNPLANHLAFPPVAALYVIRHIDSGKEYVGQSSSVRRRLRQHALARTDLYLHRAIRQHGVSAFVVKVLEVTGSLAEAEIALIACRGSCAPNGYNMTKGGDGGNSIEWTPAQRAAAATRATGRLASQATRDKMSQTQRLVSRKPQSPEVIAASTARLLAVPRPGACSEATKGRIRAAQIGRLRPHFAGKGNPMHGNTRGSAPRARAVAAWKPESMLPLIFDCVQDAAEHFNVAGPQISLWASGRTRPRSGWLFSYV